MCHIQLSRFTLLFLDPSEADLESSDPRKKLTTREGSRKLNQSVTSLEPQGQRQQKVPSAGAFLPVNHKKNESITHILHLPSVFLLTVDCFHVSAVLNPHVMIPLFYRLAVSLENNLKVQSSFKCTGGACGSV